MHHARLEQVLEELVIHHPTASLNLDNESTFLMVRIRIEGFLKSAIQAKQDRHIDFLFSLLACLDIEAGRYEMRRG